MGNLNKVMLIGRLGKDPEVRQSQAGNAVVNFTMATSERVKESSGQWGERTEWHRCVAFGNRGEAIGKYLKKGSQVYVEGALQTRSWDDKDGNKRYTTEIVVRNFEFLDSAGGNRSGDAVMEPVGNVPGVPDAAPTIDDDDIPF